MIFFYSGQENLATPEIVLGDEACLMLTYWEFHLKGGKPDKRFRRLHKHRKGNKSDADQQSRVPAKARKRPAGTVPPRRT